MRIVVLMMFLVLSGFSAQAEDFKDCEFLRDEKSCLVCNIYHEARGESLAGQTAVAIITMNRVRDARYPDTICDVVWQKSQVTRTEEDEEGNEISRTFWVGQFSWIIDGKSDRAYDKEALRIATQISDLVMAARNDSYAAVRIEGINEFTLWYHRHDVNPEWSRYKYMTAEIGSHEFFTESEELAMR